MVMVCYEIAMHFHILYINQTFCLLSHFRIHVTSSSSQVYQASTVANNQHEPETVAPPITFTNKLHTPPTNFTPSSQLRISIGPS
jgi:hypothetical protein